MLLSEEIEEIKSKLISHIDSTFPEEQRESAKMQVESMNSEQLESFLEKNNLIKNDSPQGCVFCSIASGEIKSCKIEENKKALAVLDINPISKGQALIIAKQHSEKTQKEVENLAKKIAKKIKKKFSPKSVEISKSRLFGHEVINVLPVYDNETFESKKGHSSLEELEKIKEELGQKKEKLKEELKNKVEEVKFLWLPKRIP